MFLGPPLPLPPDTPLSRLLHLTRPPETLGAWTHGCTHQFRAYCTAAGGRRSVLVSADLGFLLGRCSRVALREGTQLVVLEVELLIQWRVLQVVTATPYLPGLERLRASYPGLQWVESAMLVPLRSQTPEEVLSSCLAEGIQVTESRIVYSMHA
jgi:hypothetical protein